MTIWNEVARNCEIKRKGDRFNFQWSQGQKPKKINLFECISSQG
jgi:hypothetical protein